MRAVRALRFRRYLEAAPLMHQTKRQVRRWSVGHDATVAQCVVASPGPPGRMMRRTGADAVLILVSRR